MALTDEELRKLIHGDDWADIEIESTLTSEIESLNGFASNIRNKNTSVSDIISNISKTENEEEYFNELFKIESIKKDIKKDINDFNIRNKFIDAHKDVLLNNEIAKKDKGLLSESLDIFIEGFTKWWKWFKEFSEWIVGSGFTWGKMLINEIKWDDNTMVNRQAKLANDMDEYSKKTYNWFWKILGDNPIWNTFAAITNPIVSPALEITWTKEPVEDLFSNAALVTQSWFKKWLNVDIEADSAAWYNEWLITILTLWAWKTIFNKLKGRGDISVLSKETDLVLQKTQAIIDEVWANWNVKWLIDNPLFNKTEVERIDDYTTQVANEWLANWRISYESIKNVNESNGFEALWIRKNTSQIAETSKVLDETLWINKWQIPAEKINVGGLKNLKKALKDWDLDGILWWINEMLTWKISPAKVSWTMKSINENINKYVDGELDAKLVAIKEYNELVINKKLDNELIKKNVGIEEVIEKFNKLKTDIQTLNKIGKISKLEGTSAIKKFKKEIDINIKKATTLLKKDINASKKAVKEANKQLITFINDYGKKIWLDKKTLAIIKDQAGLNKQLTQKAKDLTEIKNKAIKLLDEAERNNVIKEFDKKIKQVKLTWTKWKPTLPNIIKLQSKRDLLNKEIKELINLKANNKLILDKKVELHQLDAKIKNSRGSRNLNIDITELAHLKIIIEKFNDIKKSWVGSVDELKSIIKEFDDFKTKVNKENFERLLDREKAANSDANSILFSDWLIERQLREGRTDKVNEWMKNNLIDLAKKGKKIVRWLFSWMDRYFIWLTNKLENSTMFNVFRNQIDNANDKISLDFEKHFVDIEKKWKNWGNKFDIKKRRETAKNLTIYSWIKQWLSDDLKRSWIDRAKRESIVKTIEWDKTLLEIYNLTINSFKDSFDKMSNTSKMEGTGDVNYVPNYFPLLRKNWQKDPEFLDVAKSGKVNMEQFIKQTMPDGFRQSRKHNKNGLDIDADFFSVAKNSLYNQYYYAYMKPQINYARNVYEKIRHQFDDIDDKVIKNYLDTVETNGSHLMPKNDLAMSVFKTVNWLSNNFAWVALSNAGTVVKQLLSEWDIVAKIWPEYWSLWKKHWTQYSVNLKKRQELYNVSPQIRERAMWEESMRVLRGSDDFVSKLNTLALTPMAWMDTHVAIPAFMWWAIKKWMELWHKFDINDVNTFTREMIQAGELTVRTTMWSGRVIDVPPVLANPLTKIFFPFQTNVMARLGMIFQDTPTKFKKGEYQEAAGIISMYLLWSSLDKIITAVRTEARTQDADELDIMDYIVAPERLISWPQWKKVKEMNETLFGADWEDMWLVQKITKLAEQSLYSEIPVINNIHSTLEYGSPFVWVEWHATKLVKDLHEATKTEGLVNKGLIIGQNVPWLSSFAKQEFRARKSSWEIESTMPYYIKVQPKPTEEE